MNQIKWIALVVVVLVISNLVTGLGISRLSKKDQEKIQKAFDSLAVVVKEQDKRILAEAILRRKIFLEDSVITHNLQKKIKHDSVLLLKQNKALSKYKHLTASQALSKLDSAYEADTVH